MNYNENLSQKQEAINLVKTFIQNVSLSFEQLKNHLSAKFGFT